MTVGVVENELRFPGQYFDVETGLHYNWNRYYEPGEKYISEDPIGLDGGLNVFMYVKGDPLNWIDPWGLKVDNIIITKTSDPVNYANAQAYIPTDGHEDRYTITAHGSVYRGGDSNNMLDDKGNRLTPQQVADRIMKDSNFHGQDIEFLSCETGLGTNLL